MSTQKATTALEELGFTSYEAEVFVSLQQLGEGTAREISEASNVPRSQVYGVADTLVENGFAEVVESSPKVFRAVSLDAACAQLCRQLDRKQKRARDHLQDLRTTETDISGPQEISTIRGRESISERAANLVNQAQEEIFFTISTELQLSPENINQLRDRASNGIDVTVVTEDPTIDQVFREGAVQVTVRSTVRPIDCLGRMVLTDDNAILLSALTDQESVDEMAIWAAGTPIAKVLNQLLTSSHG